MTGPHGSGDPHRRGGDRPSPDGPSPLDPDPAVPPGDEAPPGPLRGSGEQRRRESYTAQRQVQLLREELGRLRPQIDSVLARQHSDHVNLSSTIGLLSELLPRVDDLEQTLDALADRVATALSTSPGSRGSAPSPTGTATRPVPTPAMGWDAMDVAAATDAWEALARFVSEVLHAQYRLTRVQLPDCWPLHPRLVRELAWLRSSYLDATADERDDPASATPWHIRALPAFLANVLDTVDLRECRPGIHRLTELEVDTYFSDLTAARDADRPDPPVSTEDGPDRPTLRAQHFPRRTINPRRTNQPDPPTARSLPDLLVGTCAPTFWLDSYREASGADLQRRRPATRATSETGAEA